MLYYLFVINTTVVTLCLGIYIAHSTWLRMFSQYLSSAQIESLEKILPLYSIGNGLHMVEMAKDYNLKKLLPKDYFNNPISIDYINNMSSRACDIMWYSMRSIVNIELALAYARESNKHMYHLNTVRSFRDAAIKEFIISSSLIIYDIFSTLYKSGCLDTSNQGNNIIVNIRLSDYSGIDLGACVLFLILGYCDLY